MTSIESSTIDSNKSDDDPKPPSEVPSEVSEADSLTTSREEDLSEVTESLDEPIKEESTEDSTKVDDKTELPDPEEAEMLEALLEKVEETEEPVEKVEQPPFQEPKEKPVRKKRTSTLVNGDSIPRSTRTQANPEFAEKQKSFMKKVHMASSGSLGVLLKTPAEDRKRKRDSLSPSSIENSTTLAKKRKIGRSESEIQNDYCCWVCHKEGDVICCETCPRVYHLRCVNLNSPPVDDWVCPECVIITNAENMDLRSRAMQMLTVDQLVTLLKYALERVKSVSGSEPFCKPVDTTEFIHYREYVYHPVDLKMLEKNVRSKMYGSTEALMADMKWILHNCIIFNGTQSRLTSTAKTLVKTCRQELTEIEVCPDCYLNAHTIDTWFIEACRRPHLLVWAKLKGFPFWPAKAMRSTRDSNPVVDVRFFGAHDRAWVPVKDCFLYSTEPPMVAKKKKAFLDSSTEELEKHVKKLEEKFGTFKYFPTRTQYNHLQEEEQLKQVFPQYKSTSTRRRRGSSVTQGQEGIPSSKESRVSTPIGKRIKTGNSLDTNIIDSEDSTNDSDFGRSGSVAPSEEGGLESTPMTSGKEPSPADIEEEEEEEEDDDEFEGFDESDLPSKETSLNETFEKDDDTSDNLVIDEDKGKEDGGEKDDKEERTENAPNQSEQESSDHNVEEQQQSPMCEVSSTTNLVETSTEENTQSTVEASKASVEESDNKTESPVEDLEKEIKTEKPDSDVEMETEEQEKETEEQEKETEDAPETELTDKDTEKSDQGKETSETEVADDAEQLVVEPNMEELGLDPSVTITLVGSSASSRSQHSEEQDLSISLVDSPSKKSADRSPPGEGTISPKSAATKAKARKSFSYPTPRKTNSPAVTLPASVSNASTKPMVFIPSSSGINVPGMKVLTSTHFPPIPGSMRPITVNAPGSGAPLPRVPPPVMGASGSISVRGPQPLNFMPKGGIPHSGGPRPPQLQPRPQGPLSVTYPPPIPSEAGPASALLNKHAQKLAEFMRASLEDITKELATSGNSPEVALKALQIEYERLQWRHQQEIAELKHNADLVLMEMRSSLECDKQRAVSEMRRQCEMERNKQIEDTKKKQWCAYCQKEAIFYCCWNTSYCDYPCQQAHWPDHMSACQNVSQEGQDGVEVLNSSLSTAGSPSPIIHYPATSAAIASSNAPQTSMIRLPVHGGMQMNPSPFPIIPMEQRGVLPQRVVGPPGRGGMRYPSRVPLSVPYAPNPMFFR